MRSRHLLLAKVCLVSMILAGPAPAQSRDSWQDPNRWEAGIPARLDWKEFSSEKARFRVTFPGKPQEETVRSTDKRGEVYRCGVGFDKGRIGYDVFCNLLPEDVSPDKAREWCERRAEAVSKIKHFHFKGKKPIQLGDVPGMELERSFITSLGGKRIDVTERYFRVGKYDYEVHVNTTRGKTSREDIARFLDSFQLLDPSGEKQKERDLATGVFLQDAFRGVRDVFLTRHWMNTGPGWIEYGEGIWGIGRGRAKIILQKPQDVIAADAGATDGTLFCDLLTPAKEAMDAGLIFRLVDKDNYWLFAIRNDRVETFKKVAGSYKTYGVPHLKLLPSTTYHLKIAVKGNDMTAFIDGKQVMQVTMDAFQTATRFGFRDNSSPDCQPNWANFWVTDGRTPPEASSIASASGPAPAGTARRPKRTVPLSREDALARLRVANDLHMMGLAMVAYQSEWKHFPPADGSPDPREPKLAGLSWRAYLLPRLDTDTNRIREQQVYQNLITGKYPPARSSRAVAWNRPGLTSLELSPFKPPVAGKTAQPWDTFYRVFIGNGAAFEPKKLLSLKDFPGEAENTILIVEASEAVPWPKPDELPYDPDKPLPKLGGLFPDGFYAAFADGQVRFIPKETSEKQLRALISRKAEKLDPLPPVVDTDALRKAAGLE